MQRRRPLPKEERQRLIARIVANGRIGTQLELLDALARQGCRVTQATVSRDIRELGIGKTRDSLGQERYALPAEPRVGDARESLGAVVSEYGRRAIATQNLVVLRCEVGTAPAVAGALDRLEDRRVLGTLAGDDTCLVVAAGPREARALARQLKKYI
jgi:transcriptional regulator of arginine metabolism